MGHISDWLCSLEPEAVLILSGTNGLLDTDSMSYKANLGTPVERGFDNGTVVLLNTIPPRSGFEAKAEEFTGIVRQLARERHLLLVDYHTAILSLLPDDWDGSQPQFAAYSGYDVPTLISRDGVHPSHP